MKSKIEIGQTVYVVIDVVIDYEILEHTIECINSEGFRIIAKENPIASAFCRFEYINSFIFLTREEAEKALESYPKVQNHINTKYISLKIFDKTERVEE